MGKRKIYFRADAGANIGYGHFIRTLALADMLKDDFECRFFTQSPTEYQRQELEKVCDFVALPSDESKFELFLTYLEGDEIVVLDNYFFTTEYQREIKAKGCKLVCIDDMHDKHYIADVVINHGLSDRSLFSVEPYTKLCLGLEWALLRRAFLNPPQRSEPRSNPPRVVTTGFGGVDKYNLTGKFITQLLEFPHIEKIISIVGDGYAYDRIEDPRIEYRSNLSAEQVAAIFVESDMAILSASTICIEALACGTPIAVGWYVDNQVEFADYLKENNAAISLGSLLEGNTKHAIYSKDQLYNTINLNIVTEYISNRYISLFNQISK